MRMREIELEGRETVANTYGCTHMLCLLVLGAAPQKMATPEQVATVVAQDHLAKKSFGPAECVFSPIRSVCPTLPSSHQVCLPIEPVTGPFKAATTIGSAKVPKYVWFNDDPYIVYKPELLRCPQPFTPGQRFFIDLGANQYYSSIGEWFMKRYPLAEQYRIIAFEPNPQWAEQYKQKRFQQHHPELEFHQLATWVENKTLDFGGGALSGRVEPNHYVSPQTGKATPWKQRVAALDFVAFLEARVREEDYVVVKMDIEGAEFKVVPHLIATGATRLIDEFFLESKANNESFAAGKTNDDALQLIRDMRAAGVYSHRWG